uniref:Uncharacterized protein n=1 Tax=viral metagenome TaxID=1070528 RepID=A0A6M3JZ11_9ZZZZ
MQETDLEPKDRVYEAQKKALITKQEKERAKQTKPAGNEKIVTSRDSFELQKAGKVKTVTAIFVKDGVKYHKIIEAKDET